VRSKGFLLQWRRVRAIIGLVSLTGTPKEARGSR